MHSPNSPAAAAGTWQLGDLTVNRLGFGAMRLTGSLPFGKGTPSDRDRSIAVLCRAVELGVNHIDTAAFYFSALRSANELISTALAPYRDGLVITTKVGPGRDSWGEWHSARPDQLRGQVEENLRQLGRDHLDVVNLRRRTGQESIAEHFGALAELRAAGLIRRPPGRPRPPPARRQRGPQDRHRFRRGLATTHRRNASTPPRLRLYRLGALTPPQPSPEGQARVTGEHDREQLRLWCNGFADAVGQVPSEDAGSWARRYACKRFTFWETPDGTPVSIAGTTPLTAGQIRVDPVYTPAHLRGRGYAGAVTVAASRAALAAGATEVVLFTDLSNPASNSLYQHIGYLPVTDFATYDFSGAAPEVS